MISTSEEEPTSPTSVRLKTPPTVEMIDHSQVESAAEEAKKVDNSDLSSETTDTTENSNTESTIEKKSEPENPVENEVKVDDETVEEKIESKIEIEAESKANETATISTYENPLLVDVRLESILVSCRSPMSIDWWLILVNFSQNSLLFLKS